MTKDSGLRYLVTVHGSEVQGFKGSGVQRFPAESGIQRFHFLYQTEFEMRIYEKSVSFVRHNPKFRDKLAIIWENVHI
jgi:hypothetical protein